MYKSSKQQFQFNNISYNNNVIQVIITISQHIQNPDIFNTCRYVSPMSHLNQCLMRHIISKMMRHWEPWHSQNSLFRHFQEYSGTFSNIQTCSGIPKGHQGIVMRYIQILLRIWHIRNPGIFRILPKLHPNAYSEPCHIYENRQTLCTLDIQNLGILTIREYLDTFKFWHVFRTQSKN